ncbi:MAG: pentapeptide repeat-containing protein [Leptolyngbya sp. SIO4C1]|nr:pentapeptide repeat-containing protein [Leptolyngbya sp. SIO4C1]
MMTDSPLSFVNQDLRNCSFYQRDLRQAVFERCDLRGCDFRRAQLQAATFRQVKLGKCPVRLLGYSAIVIGAAVLMFNAVSRLAFAVLGQTVQDPTWPYALALYVNLAIAGITVPRGRRPWQQLTVGITAAAAGALLGFYYVGSLSGNSARPALLGAAIGGLSLAIVRLWQLHRGLVAAAMVVSNAIAAYGFAFLAIGLASAGFSTGHLGLGALWGGLTAVYFSLSLRGLLQCDRSLRFAAATKFQGADLTDAVFEDSRPSYISFENALGLLSSENL